jgi:hypothetical protein
MTQRSNDMSDTYITTRDDIQPGTSPSVTVLSVHRSRAAAERRSNGACNVLPVWEMRGRRAPKAGERVGTYRDGRTLYAVGEPV